MRYVKNKGNARLDTIDKPTNATTGVEMTRKKQEKERGKDSRNSDGQQEEKKVRLRSNDEKH